MSVIPANPTATLGAQVRDHLERLLPRFDLTTARPLVLDAYDLVTRESLALDLAGPLPRFSTINSDGVPLELSVSLGAGAGGLRLLSEIGVPGTSVPARLALTRARLPPLLHRLGLAGAAPALDAALAPLVPTDPAALAGWQGGIWVALAFLPGGRAGLRLYVNGAVGDRRERWLRAGRALARLDRLHACAALADLAPLVSGFAEPLGVALEAEPSRVGRVKLYLRSTRARAEDLTALLAATGHRAHVEHLAAFLAIHQPGDRALPAGALVVSLEFAGDTGAVDVKVDVCSHCCFASDLAAQAACRSLIVDGGFAGQDYEAMVAELAGGALSRTRLAHHAFVGLGLAHARPPRLNLYLKPAAPAPAAPVVRPGPARPIAAPGDVAPDVDATLARGAAFLLAHQSRGGQWLDFALPVGPSDAWVTAYVGLALAGLPAALRTPAVDAAIARAADWCEAAMGGDHGWGYHAFTGSDADSTAHAIRFLRAAGRAVPAGCLARLREFQRVDGGFATYQREHPDDTWGHSHADVTAAVLLALAPSPNAGAAVAAGAAYAAAQQRTDGGWPSYWWHSPAYATRVNVAALRHLGVPFDTRAAAVAAQAAAASGGPFDLALALATTVDIDGAPPAGALAALAAAQDVDGSWPSAPVLRLTDPRCATPWLGTQTGTLYADPRRLFTTATALTGLAAGRA